MKVKELMNVHTVGGDESVPFSFHEFVNKILC